MQTFEETGTGHGVLGPIWGHSHTRPWLQEKDVRILDGTNDNEHKVEKKKEKHRRKRNQALLVRHSRVFSGTPFSPLLQLPPFIYLFSSESVFFSFCRR